MYVYIFYHLWYRQLFKSRSVYVHISSIILKLTYVCWHCASWMVLHKTFVFTLSIVKYVKVVLLMLTNYRYNYIVNDVRVHLSMVSSKVNDVKVDTCMFYKLHHQWYRQLFKSRSILCSHIISSIISNPIMLTWGIINSVTWNICVYIAYCQMTVKFTCLCLHIILLYHQWC